MLGSPTSLASVLGFKMKSNMVSEPIVHSVKSPILVGSPVLAGICGEVLGVLEVLHPTFPASVLTSHGA